MTIAEFQNKVFDLTSINPAPAQDLPSGNEMSGVLGKLARKIFPNNDLVHAARMSNQAARETFLNSVYASLERLGYKESIPPSVLKALNLDDFKSVGKPLSERRIQKVYDAIRQLADARGNPAVHPAMIMQAKQLGPMIKRLINSGDPSVAEFGRQLKDYAADVAKGKGTLEASKALVDKYSTLEPELSRYSMKSGDSLYAVNVFVTNLLPAPVSEEEPPSEEKPSVSENDQSPDTEGKNDTEEVLDELEIHGADVPSRGVQDGGVTDVALINVAPKKSSESQQLVKSELSSKDGVPGEKGTRENEFAAVMNRVLTEVEEQNKDCFVPGKNTLDLTGLDLDQSVIDRANDMLKELKKGIRISDSSGAVFTARMDEDIHDPRMTMLFIDVARNSTDRQSALKYFTDLMAKSFKRHNAIAGEGSQPRSHIQALPQGETPPAPVKPPQTEQPVFDPNRYAEQSSESTPAEQPPVESHKPAELHPAARPTVAKPSAGLPQKEDPNARLPLASKLVKGPFLSSKRVLIQPQGSNLCFMYSVLNGLLSKANGRAYLERYLAPGGRLHEDYNSAMASIEKKIDECLPPEAVDVQRDYLIESKLLPKRIRDDLSGYVSSMALVYSSKDRDYNMTSDPPSEGEVLTFATQCLDLDAKSFSGDAMMVQLTNHSQVDSLKNDIQNFKAKDDTIVTVHLDNHFCQVVSADDNGIVVADSLSGEEVGFTWDELVRKNATFNAFSIPGTKPEQATQGS